MKEATGEVSMTVIVIIAVAVIGGIMAVMWGPIKSKVQKAWGGSGNDISGECPAGTTYDSKTGYCK